MRALMGFEISVGEKFASWVFSICDLRLPDGLSASEVGRGLWVSAGDELPFELDAWCVVSSGKSWRTI